MSDGSTEAHLISYLFNLVDRSGADLVANTYHNLVNQYAALVWSLAGIYLGFVFLKMKRGLYGANDFIYLSLRMVVLLTLAMNYQYFCLFIYDVFTKAPLILCKSIAVSHGEVSVTSVNQSLDAFLHVGMKETSRLFEMGSWSNITYSIFGCIFYVMTVLTIGMAAGLIILSKCASTVLLALSPLFILCALFDTTKGLFDGYIRQLVNYALLPIMTCTVLMILLSVTNVLISDLQAHPKLTLMDIVPYGLMCLIEIYLLNEVRGKCSALAGGFSLPGIISSLKQSQGHVSSMGNVAKAVGVGMAAVGLAGSATTHATNRMSRFK